MNNENPLKTTKAEAAGEVATIALNAVPIVGGVLAGIADTLIERRQNQRLEKFLLDLANDLQNLQDRVNTEFIRNEHFNDLAENIFSKAAETRQQEKLEAFKAIFLNTTLSKHPNYNEAEEITKLIDGWQPRHIILLKILDNPQKVNQHMNNVVTTTRVVGGSIYNNLEQLLPNWERDEIERTWKDLYDAHIHSTEGIMTMISDSSIYNLENRLTKFGRKVANYLRNPNS